MSPTRNLADVIRQCQRAKQKVDFIRDAILSLQEPTLSHVTVLRKFLRTAFSEHIGTVRLFPPEALEQQAEDFENFDELYKEAQYALAKKYAAAKRRSAQPPGEADQIAAKAWLMQQLTAWESLQADIPEHIDESQKARSQTLDYEEAVPRECAPLTGSNQPSTSDSRPREKPAKNARVDTTSNALDVTNHGPQEPAETVAPEDHPTSTGSQNDITASAKHNQMLPAVYSCLGHVARVAKIRNRPGRVHPDCGQEVRIVAEHTPMLPPTVKAHDKRGQPRSCRIHPDDGALQDHQPGRCWPAHECQRQGWLPTDPPDKVVSESCSPEKDHPPNEMKLLRFLNRGEYVRYHRKGNPAVRTPLRPPCQLTVERQTSPANQARVRTRPTAN